MKLKKRLLSALVCVCLVFTMFAGTVMADTTGTCSITVQNQSGTNATVAGKTLNLFKIFDATTDGTNISYDWAKDSSGNAIYKDFFFGCTLERTVTTDEGTTIVEVTYPKLVEADNPTIHDVIDYIDELDDSYEFSQMASSLHEYIHDKNISPDKTSGTIDSNATSYTFSGLNLGYYLIYDATDLSGADAAVRSAAMLVHSGENKVITLKADRPHIVKYVDDSDMDPTDANYTADWKYGATASIGDTVTFKIVTAIPDHDLYGENYTFEITDVMDNTLYFVPNSVEVKLTEPEVTADTDDETSEQNDFSYTVYDTESELKDANVTDSTIDFKVVFNKITDLKKDTVVEITYTAVVTADAAKTNTNTATLTYSNDPNNSALTGSVSSSANVYLWQFTLTKFLEDASGIPSVVRLPGATFEIYKKGDLNNPLKFTTTELTNSDGDTYLKYTYNPNATENYVTTLSTLDICTKDDGMADVGFTDGGYLGQILIFGLGEGTYVIRETKAPDGYQIAKGDFEFTVSDLVGPYGVISEATINTATRTEAPGQFTDVHIDRSAQKYYVGITNAPGAALPETGGMGTTVFMVAGIAIMAAAVSILVVRKKRTV